MRYSWLTLSFLGITHAQLAQSVGSSEKRVADSKLDIFNEQSLVHILQSAVPRLVLPRKSSTVLLRCWA